MGWDQLMLEPLRLLVSQLAILIPKAIGSLLILVVGWAVANLLRRLVTKLLQTIGLQRLAEKTKLSDMLRRGAIRLTATELLGALTYWLVLVATVMVALQFMGITAAVEWLERFGAFIPRIIISIAVFLLGMLVASFLGTTVRVASLNAGLPQGHLLGRTVYTMVLLVTVIISLEQLQVVTRTIEVALYILLATFGLAFALALGLGSQGLVKQMLEELLGEQWKPPRDP